MKSDIKILDILAYYLSEFDSGAFSFLGYDTQSKGFDNLSKVFGCKSSYIRRLRDEYDVVTNSTRHGQRNRPPRKRVLETKARLQTYSFEELSEMILAFIENAHSDSVKWNEDIQTSKTVETTEMSEQNIEQIINYTDSNARLKITNSSHSVRVYNTSIVRQLKKLYGGKCQLCAQTVEIKSKTVDISEAHHIEYFSSSQNNNAGNLIIVCPNCHALIHKLNPRFDNTSLKFVFEDNYEMPVRINYHL